MKNYKILISIFSILVVTFIAFSPVFKNGFTNWDDDIYVTKNTIIKNLSWGNLKKIFTSFILGNYHPVTLLSFAIEYNFFKLKPADYHMTNLILHMINCILVFGLMFMLTGEVSIAIVAAFIFAIHPLHVDTVAWVSGRKDLLCALFYFGTLIFYLFYLKKRAIKFYCFALVLFTLSLFSKAMSVTLPAVLILFDYYQHRKIDKKVIKEKIPFLVIALVFGTIAVIARQSYQIILHEYNVPFLDKVLINIQRFVFYYMLRIIAPVSLSRLIPHFVESTRQSLTIFVSTSIGVIAGLITLITFSVKYTKKIIFASLFFFIAIFPALTITVVGFSADRFTYIPIIGIFYIVAEGFFWLYNKRFKLDKAFKSVILIVLLIAISTLDYLTWHRCHIWEDSITLNSEFIRNFPNDPRTYINRAAGYNEQSKYDLAVADLTQALKINPNYAEAYYNRGNVYCNKGDYPNAIADYNRALDIKPDFGEAYYERGTAYKDMGQYYLAITDFTKALMIDSNCVNAYYNRGNSYYALGDYDLAIADYTQTLLREPKHAKAYVNRGNLYGLKKMYDKSIADYTWALRIDPSFVEAYYNRGNSYAFIGKHDKAIADFAQAIRINPNFVQAYINRAHAYLIGEDYDKAWEDVRKIQSMGIQVAPEFLHLLRRGSGTPQ